MSIVTATLNPCIDKTFSVERVVPDEKLGAEDVRVYPGGGGLNVARAVHALGGEVRALWTCGGSVGERLVELVEREGVPHEAVPTEGTIRENLIVSQTASEDQYRFSLPGPVLTEAERARWRDRMEQATAADYVVLSGSLPREAPVTWYGELIEALPEPTRVVVDSKEDSLAQAWEVGVHLVKPNLRELGQLAGRAVSDDDEIERAARALVERGAAEVVLVSLGRGGAMLVEGDRCERLAAPTVPMRSKVGAGDSMVGGVVYALDSGWSLGAAAAFGVASGAAAVMSPDTGLCRREDVERLHARMVAGQAPGGGGAGQVEAGGDRRGGG